MISLSYTFNQSEALIYAKSRHSTLKHVGIRYSTPKSAKRRNLPTPMTLNQKRHPKPKQQGSQLKKKIPNLELKSARLCLWVDADMSPKSYRRGYSVAVLIGLEQDHAAVWQIFSNVAKQQQTVPLNGGRSDSKAVYSFHEAIVNAIRSTLKEGVKSIIVAAPPGLTSHKSSSVTSNLITTGSFKAQAKPFFQR